MCIIAREKLHIKNIYKPNAELKVSVTRNTVNVNFIKDYSAHARSKKSSYDITKEILGTMLNNYESLDIISYL